MLTAPAVKHCEHGEKCLQILTKCTFSDHKVLFNTHTHMCLNGVNRDHPLCTLIVWTFFSDVPIGFVHKSEARTPSLCQTPGSRLSKSSFSDTLTQLGKHRQPWTFLCSTLCDSNRGPQWFPLPSNCEDILPG